MTLCTRCGINEAPSPARPEIDPLCDPCIEVLACPGWDDSCANLREEAADLCGDCLLGRLDAQSPR